MEQWKELAQRLCAVSAYREFLQLPAMEALGRLVRALAAGGAGGALMDAYAETFYQLQLADKKKRFNARIKQKAKR